MKQQRKLPLLHILISALIVVALLAACGEGVAQGLTHGKTVNPPEYSTSVPSSESTTTAPGDSTTDITADIPPGTIPEAAPSPSNALEGKLEVHFIDVGQADAILIKQGASAMLVDAGNNADSDLVVQYIKDQGVTRLDYVIGTHPHEDHIGGMDAVIMDFQVEKIIMPRVVVNTKTYEDVLMAIHHKGLKVTTPVPGTKYDLGYAKFTILAPNSDSYEDVNNYSVVIRLDYGQNSFLLTGDAEALSEQEMLDKELQLKTDVLKVGHHGSTTSTTEDFLDAVVPSYAVISVGHDNSYGHPAKSVIERLTSREIQIYRTDEKGTIIAISDGTAIQFAFGKDIGGGTASDAQTTPIAAPGALPPSQGASLPKAGNVEIINVDLRKEVVTLKNKSNEDVDLSGWVLLSVKGDQSFTFPPGSIIKAGSTLTIASGDAEGDIKWTSKNIWNNDGDPAKLINAEGIVVSEY